MHVVLEVVVCCSGHVKTRLIIDWLIVAKGDRFDDTRSRWRSWVGDVIPRVLQSWLHQLVLRRRPVWQQNGKKEPLGDVHGTSVALQSVNDTKWLNVALSRSLAHKLSLKYTMAEPIIFFFGGGAGQDLGPVPPALA